MDNNGSKKLCIDLSKGGPGVKVDMGPRVKKDHHMKELQLLSVCCLLKFNIPSFPKRQVCLERLLGPSKFLFPRKLRFQLCPTTVN